MNATLRRFLLSWHWIWVIGAAAVAWASLWLGDPRPLLVVLWWMGFVALGGILFAGVIGGLVVLVVGIRQNLRRNRKG